MVINVDLKAEIPGRTHVVVKLTTLNTVLSLTPGVSLIMVSPGLVTIC